MRKDIYQDMDPLAPLALDLDFPIPADPLGEPSRIILIAFVHAHRESCVGMSRIDANDRKVDTTELVPKPTEASRSPALRRRVGRWRRCAASAALCNPGDGRGLNEFTGNPGLAKRRWRERFREPLDEALNSSLLPQRSDTSPLLATLQGIAIDRFAGKAAGEIPKSLVIVSDMIENGKEYKQYPPADLRYQRFEATPVYLKLRTDLNGASVQILYVQRITRPPIDYGTHIQFWLDWIQDNHGRLSRATKLQGAGQS